MKKDDQRSMRCPICSGDMIVSNTRSARDEPNAVRRYRTCLECGARFITIEKIVKQIREGQHDE